MELRLKFNCLYNRAHEKSSALLGGERAILAAWCEERLIRSACGTGFGGGRIQAGGMPALRPGDCSPLLHRFIEVENGSGERGAGGQFGAVQGGVARGAAHFQQGFSVGRMGAE